MEVVTAARKKLLSVTTIQALVGDRVWKFDDETELEGTGQVAIVLSVNGQWSGPQHSSVEFPLLVVDVKADHTRDDDGMVKQDDREERCYGVHRAIDRVLHWKDLAPEWWMDPSGLYVLGSRRGSLPGAPTLKDGVAVVRASFDLVTVHSG